MYWTELDSSSSMLSVYTQRKTYALCVAQAGSVWWSRPDGARVEVERCPGRGPAAGDALHEREPHVLGRLPVPLPLVDEPVVDLLRVQPSRRRQPHLVLLLHRRLMLVTDLPFQRAMLLLRVCQDACMVTVGYGQR
jgi:hypothetical protein